MNIKQMKWRIRYAMQYFPFTLNTLLCTAAFWGGYHLLYKPTPKGEDQSSLMPFIILMGKMTFMLLAFIVIISVLSTIATWIYYLIQKSNGKLLTVDFNIESRKGRKNRLFLYASLPGAIRPLLGFVKGRLIYDDNQMTDQFSLMSGQRKERSIWRLAITGKSNIVLPDIKEYDLKGGFVYFQDMLHLFSLAVPQPISGHFYQPPVLMQEQDADVYPKKTETLDVRIEQMRRVEGEHTNYKDFEAGDDVRRIVWKVYARNRELVVRIPEMFEPYASHLNYYASFFADVKDSWLDDGYLKEMLNYYKNNVWTVYDTLSKKEWQMSFVPDQEFTVADEADDAAKTARIISNSEWHKDKSLSEYFSPKNGTVLCISSLTDPHDLANLLERCDASTVVYFVKVSQVFKHYAALNLLSRLIIRPPQDRLSKLRTRWLFSPMRLQVNKREQAIEALLKKSDVVWGEL
ncbi:hypothetical protein CJD36_019275 [Flavipsychrobacter stenotrophus]|uniref:Uncharacterized protein n=1 Tax=Flavipsychrobacter stenotrophus TaxID=2077091 RepID=A0A2S7SRP5_9BACT|nr:DUF58 domain-containing protein [Flavipsychrobacter stenotrophus]PQJ09388.1 hypothetical protein CJD36_019275 [Flavipsychrobacter stenotrophus]